MKETTIPTLPPQDWKPLGLFNFYRLCLAVIFLITYLTDVAPNFFGQYDPRLYLVVSILYLLSTITNIALIQYRFPSLNTQVLAQGIVDIIAISLIMHASGGISSGLGILLGVSIVGSSILRAGGTAVFFAACATLAVLLEVVITDLYHIYDQTNYTQAGLLGAVFFAIAYLAHAFAQRLRISEALGQEQALYAQQLEQLNGHIVRHIRSGILVIDSHQCIRLCNDAAMQLSQLHTSPENQPLASSLSGLAVCLEQWQKGNNAASQIWVDDSRDVNLIATFSPLTQAGLVSTLIVLEDANLTTQRAQQLKLASLGRLTASIAHEVRNPLAAISQAAQLLAESDNMNQEDNHLMQIILSHCQRMNTIVENVLQLSRQREANEIRMELISWLNEIIQQLKTHYNLDDNDILCEKDMETFFVHCDPDHLYQVVWNLCDNALRYSQRSPRIHFIFSINPNSTRPYLDIIDTGTGMPEHTVSQIFEPFFTTQKSNGTGLGLYISRELCAMNRASLHLIHNTADGCCFRISFSQAMLPHNTTTPSTVNSEKSHD